MAGTYVKTNGTAGKAALIIRCAQAGEIKIDFEIVVEKNVRTM